MEKYMDQSIGGGESQITPEILEKIKKEGCPECGLKGGTHIPECYYFGAISPEMAAMKQPLVPEAPKMESEAPVEKKEEKEMTPEEEKKFREELLKRAKPFEEVIAAPPPAGGPTVEIPKPIEIPAAGAPEKEGVFEELFARPEPVKAAEAEKIEKPAIEEKEIVPPPAEIKAVKEEVLSPKPAAVEVKEPKKEDIAANAVVAAAEMARNFISAGSTKITEEQAEKAAQTALKDWERITAGMTVDERFKTFGAAERAILDKIPEGKILEKLKEKIYIVMKEEK